MFPPSVFSSIRYGVFAYIFFFQDVFYRILEVEIGTSLKNSEYRGKPAAASMERSADFVI
jgi:hypothetical protein